MSDLMAEQLAIEEEMVNIGASRFTERTNALIQSGELSLTQAGREMCSGGIDRVADKLCEWLQDQWCAARKSGARKSLAYETMANMDRHVAAFIALRATMDGLMDPDNSYQRVALRVGSAIEDENRYRAMREHNPRLFKWALEQASHTSSQKQKRVVMNWTSTTSGLQWTNWSKDLQLRVGVVMVEMVRLACGIIEVHMKPAVAGRKNDRSLYIHASHATLAWLKAYNLEAKLMRPLWLPTIVPPKPWTDPWSGGYWSDSIRRLRLVKTNKQTYLEEFEVLKPTKVYDAVNRLQETPWAVNTEVLDVLESLWQGQSCVAGLPRSEDPPLPSKPDDIATNPESRKAYRRKAAAAWDARIEVRSKRVQVLQILTIAKRFKDFKQIFFPYQLDFRGRVYAVPVGLQPQGHDVARGLLKFAEGKPLSSPSAINWWKIHGANCFGVDKVSFEDRLAWVEENQGNIIDASIHPKENLWWTKADSPWLFLAWCLEFGRWFEAPDSFVSHLPINLDASCSGLQHFSAMLRDHQGALSTNLVPGDVPRDIYTDVAEVTKGLLQDLTSDAAPVCKTATAKCKATKGEFASQWLAYGITRKLTKRPVMTLPYGSTIFGCRQFVMDTLKEGQQEGRPHPFGEYAVEASSFMATVIWQAIGEIVVAARHAMGWLQDAANVAAQAGLSVSWVTPSGFPVLQAYQDLKSRRLKLALGDTTIRLTLAEEKEELDKRRQASGISPNFVHSCDAAALVLAVTKAAERGLKSFCCVHDSFGTHAADTDLLVTTVKETFVEMYQTHDVLSDFKRELEGLGVKIPEVPPKGSLDISEVLKSAYCFA